MPVKPEFNQLTQKKIVIPVSVRATHVGNSAIVVVPEVGRASRADVTQVGDSFLCPIIPRLISKMQQKNLDLGWCIACVLAPHCK